MSIAIYLFLMYTMIMELSYGKKIDRVVDYMKQRGDIPSRALNIPVNGLNKAVKIAQMSKRIHDLSKEPPKKSKKSTSQE